MPIHGYPGNVITANPTAPTVSSASGVWTTEQQLLAVSQGNWPGYEYPISRSLRFNSADTAYLNRTPATATNRRTWTWSGWVKRGALGSAIYPYLITAYDSSGARETYFNIEGDCLRFAVDNTSSGNIYLIQTTQVFRDPSAWYHIMVVLDTTQATTSNRLKMYVNGTQITAFSTANYPAQNYDATINLNVIHNIGRSARAAAYYYDGYMTEVNFIDGQALDPSSFGLNDPETGVWSPKRYTGTYGTNGFYLNFSDNSGTTSTTLGKDYSGNGNNWTPNNFSVTAGSGNDSLVDSPTAYGTDTGIGGEVRGNYCTLNPLNKQSNLTLSNGNLDTSSPVVGTWRSVVGTVAMTSGKWYWEATAGANGAANHYFVGIAATSFNALTDNVYIGSTTDTWGYYGANGAKYNNSTGVGYGATYTTNDVIGIAYDADSGTLTFYKNGVSQGTAYTGLTGAMVAGTTGYNGSGMYHNFGQRAFAYTAPSGFKALCTQNLPTPTIGATSTTQANRYFDVVLRNGFGSSGGSITSLNFQPDFWWEKARNNTYSHQWLDVIRGVGATGYSLSSNSTTAEVTQTNYLLSFNPNGYTLGTNDYSVATTLVDWCWKGGGTGVTNTAGTITSTVSASTTAGFSVVTYTGTGANATVGHGLGVAPQMIIIKNRQAANSWVVYHVSIGNGNVLLLNSTNASTADSTAWNTTTPTSTVFSLGSGAAADTNQTSGGGQHVAYCFAPVAGYSAFGSFTGNGSADGPFVYTGFRPKWVMLKSATQAYKWYMLDAARNTYNVMNGRLFANASTEEVTTADILDFTSNGFKIRTTDAEANGSGQTIIYACFAESPFKYALAR